jgi:transcriptional regulator with XRE-family HTH domain
MTKDQGNLPLSELAQQRLNELLEQLAQEGLTQQAAAARANLPPQYLSDMKRGHRTITELVARRLAEEFDLDHRWLLGISSTRNRPPLVAPSGGGFWLPVLSHPVEGDPREHPDWDGTGIELAGFAVAKLVRAVQPYVLRFGHNDIHQKRLKKKDLILISQGAPKKAEIAVVKSDKKAFLARRQDDGTWQRVANGATLPKTSVPIGYCVGVIWSSL